MFIGRPLLCSAAGPTADCVEMFIGPSSWKPAAASGLSGQQNIKTAKHPDQMPLKRKSLSLHWERMFTRSLYETPDMIYQHHLLNRISALIDQGVLQTTVGEHFGAINAANMRRAHALVESGKVRGKIVLEGF